MDLNIVSDSANWNLILLILVGCSIIGFTVFIERLILLQRSEIDVNRLIIEMRRTIKDGDIMGAIEICDATQGAVSQIVRAGLSKYNRKRSQVESAMEISSLVEIARLEKNAKILSIISHTAPLIGLLGTVLGFIQAFSEMRLSGLVDISATRIGEAMEYALITTAAGLVVAIPSGIGYNYLVSRIENIVLEMQTCAAEVLDLLSSQEESL